MVKPTRQSAPLQSLSHNTSNQIIGTLTGYGKYKHICNAIHAHVCLAHTHVPRHAIIIAIMIASNCGLGWCSVVQAL